MKLRNWFITAITVLLLLSVNTQAQQDTVEQRDPEFLTNADQLVQDLTARLTLSEDQAAEIREILIDYQSNIKTADAPDAESDLTADNAETGFEEEDQTQTETDTNTETDIYGETETDLNTDTSAVETDINSDWNNENETDLGLEPETESANGDPQQQANTAIEEVLNETQRTTWTIISDAWWRDVNSRYGWGQSQQ